MSAPPPASLAGFLSLVEKHGSALVLARSLEALAPPDARAALHAAGVIAASQASASWPCEVRGCSREIRANYDGAKKPLVAVCFQSPAVCSAVELGFDEVAQQLVAADALVAAVCGLLGAPIDRAALAKIREVRPLGESRAPILVATLDSARDVFWAGSPRDTDLAAWCARRERATRGTLVLVPTARYVPLEVMARFAPGDLVEVRALGDLIEAREGRLALREAGTRADELHLLRSDPPPPAAAPPPAGGIASLLGATRWEEIRITIVDGHTVRIEANGKTLLRTFVELGFVDGRKRDIVTPTTAWPLFRLFCEKKRLKPSAYGEQGHKPFRREEGDRANRGRHARRVRARGAPDSRLLETRGPVGGEVSRGGRGRRRGGARSGREEGEEGETPGSVIDGRRLRRPAPRHRRPRPPPA